MATMTIGVGVGSIPLLQEAVPETHLGWQALALGERLASMVLMAAASPVVAGSALTLSLLSGRTPLIAHRRVGWRGSPLWMLKLRTMWNDEPDPRPRQRGWIEYIEDDHGPQLKDNTDSRVNHWFARFCRRHSIDEIPQLWHVFRGEMSLVGPRPITSRELERYYGADTDEILQMKPGIAGLWQISGRNRLSYAERRKLDLKLVRNRSLRMYFEILLRTLPEVWSGTYSW